jgi:ribosomal protein S14
MRATSACRQGSPHTATSTQLLIFFIPRRVLRPQASTPARNPCMNPCRACGVPRALTSAANESTNEFRKIAWKSSRQPALDHSCVILKILGHSTKHTNRISERGSRNRTSKPTTAESETQETSRQAPAPSMRLAPLARLSDMHCGSQPAVHEMEAHDDSTRERASAIRENRTRHPHPASNP